jgi:hypothetical protein
MNVDLGPWIEILKYGVSAIGGGVVGSILTAWNGWGIEKRRLKRQQRSQLIENWRKLIATLPDNGGWSAIDQNCRAFLRSEHFISLEAHLPTDLLNKLRRERSVHVEADFPRRTLSKYVADLERQWGLV